MAASRALTEARKRSLPTLRVALRGEGLLTHPTFNKGTGFTHRERKAFGLTGRLPSRVNTLDEQIVRAYEQLNSRKDPLRKNSFLQSLKDQNWILYYALVAKHLKELVPIIYTPTQVRHTLVAFSSSLTEYMRSKNSRRMRSRNIHICLGEAKVCI